MIHIAVVEDEQESRQLMESYLQEYAQENEEEIHVTTYSDGLAFLDGYHSSFDVVIMDIAMPYLNGLEVARRLRHIDTTVRLIFITNMAQYAIKGYEVDATDYIVKPVGYYVFATKLKKALRDINRFNDISFTIPFDGGIRVIYSSSIYYIEVANHDLIFHTAEGEFKKRSTLAETEKQLQNHGFSRCNNCYLVNLRFVSGITNNSVIVGKEVLQMSRPKYKKFREAFMKFCGGI